MSIDTKTIRDLHAKRGDHPWGSSFEHAAYQHMPELLDAYDRLSALEVESLRQQLAAAQAEARNWKRIAEDATHVEREELTRVREIVSGMREYADSCDHPSEASKRNAVEYWLAQLEGALSQPAEQHDPLAVSDHCPECSEPEPECVCGEQPAERESLPLTFTQGVLCSLSILDGYGDSIAYREVANPHDLNQLWEEADEFDREHLARHGYRPTPAAQESDQ